MSICNQGMVFEGRKIVRILTDNCLMLQQVLTQLASMPLSASSSRLVSTHSEPSTRPIACCNPLPVSAA